MNVKFMTVLLGVLLVVGFVSVKTKQTENQSIRNGYKVTLSKNKTAIFVAGKFDHGISDEVAKLYLANKNTVKSIMYSSTGGKLHESITLYQLAHKNNLNTYAINNCMSACTTAFVGGRNRISLVQTKFGFHQFGAKGYEDIEPDNTVFVAAQNINTNLFEKQGVKKEFLNQIYDAEHTEIWSPNFIELLKANVVHKFVYDLNTIPDFDITNKRLYPDI